MRLFSCHPVPLKFFVTVCSPNLSTTVKTILINMQPVLFSFNLSSTLFTPLHIIGNVFTKEKNEA